MQKDANVKRTLTLTAAATAIAALAVTGPALAQDSTGTGSVDAPAPSEAYPEVLLENFVTAAMEVARLRQTFAERIETAETEETRAALAADAGDEMRAAVVSTDGITLEQYQEIGALAEENDALRTRLQQILSDRQDQQGG